LKVGNCSSWQLQQLECRPCRAFFVYVATISVVLSFAASQFALGREGAAALQQSNVIRTNAAAAAAKQKHAAPVQEQLIDQVRDCGLPTFCTAKAAAAC
jgi:hypothetical protein